MYPVSYAADYAAEGRNRLTTFFRSFVAIPWLIVAYLYGIGASIVVVIAWFAMVFTGRYPQRSTTSTPGTCGWSTGSTPSTTCSPTSTRRSAARRPPSTRSGSACRPPLDTYSR